MDNLKTILNEAFLIDAKKQLLNTQPINLPDLWYHGDENFPKYQEIAAVTRKEYYQGAKPDAIKRPVPSEIETMYNNGKIKNIHHISYSNWKVHRTYNGRSNFGFGIYLTGDLDWANQYGNYITVANINPDYILSGNWDDRENIDTVMGAVYTKVKQLAGDRMADQAKVFYRAIKSVNSKKKALYVQTSSGKGQLIVYDPSIIHASAVIEI
jgi:hypothetical protein